MSSVLAADRLAHKSTRFIYQQWTNQLMDVKMGWIQLTYSWFIMLDAFNAFVVVYLNFDRTIVLAGYFCFQRNDKERRSRLLFIFLLFVLFIVHVIFHIFNLLSWIVYDPTQTSIESIQRLELSSSRLSSQHAHWFCHFTINNQTRAFVSLS